MHIGTTWRIRWIDLSGGSDAALYGAITAAAVWQLVMQ